MSDRIIVLYTNGGMHNITLDRKATFEDVYELIDTDMIQIVKGKIEIDTNKGIKKKTVQIWTDEEGKLKNKKRNKGATHSYWGANKYAEQIGTYLVGDVAFIIPNYKQYEV